MVKGYKVFNSDWTCRDFQYTCPGKFEMDMLPDLCERGFHFCTNINDCFHYYWPVNETYHFAEVIAYGDIAVGDDDVDSKCCTNKIEIVREIPFEEVVKMSNSGSRNSGLVNSGSCNTGNWNTGDRNTGDCNTGNWNTGDCNTGNWNTGNWNTGDRNTGDCNTGNCNTGNCNTGDRNTGDWNKTSCSAGCFNTEKSTIPFFNKPSDWTIHDWQDSVSERILSECPSTIVEWIYEEDMTDDEKESHPEYKATGGYLKVYDETKTRQLWWDGLSKKSKQAVLSLPNFDPDIFKECTGIEVRVND